MAAVARFVSWWSLMGLSVQTSRWELAMNKQLMELGAALEEASRLKTVASMETADAAENHDLASSQETEAASLQKEAAALMEQSEGHQGVAVADKVEEEEVASDIVAEQAEAAAHAAAAAAEEAASDAAAGEAALDAAEAARFEAQARGEEIGIAICEFIPILDVACDVVGGVTAVGLEGGAALEAVKATSETVTAAATKSEEEREVALAAEFEEKAVSDVVAEGQLESEAAEMEELAEEERLRAEEKEAAAETLLQEAETEEGLATEEEAAANDASVESIRQTVVAVEKSVVAFWNGVMAGACGFLSFAFFFFRAVSNVIFPGTKKLFIQMTQTSSSSSTSTSGRINTQYMSWQYSIGRDISYAFHHCVIFLVVAASFHSLFVGLSNNTIKARGGILLYFAFTAAFVQAVALHILPSGMAGIEDACSLILHFLRRMIVLPVLFTIEILIIWVIFGAEVFTKPDFARLILIVFWMSLALSLAVHVALLELPRLRLDPNQTQTISDVNDKHISTGETDKEEWVDLDREPCEIDSLISDKNKNASSSKNVDGSPTRLNLLFEEISSLQLPLEALTLTCLYGIIFHSVASVKEVFPMAKAMLMHSRPKWVTLVGSGLVGTVLLLCFGLVLFNGEKNDKKVIKSSC